MELHITQLNMLWRCGEQYRRRYICGDRIPPVGAIIVGKATHKSIESNLKNKIDKKALLPDDVVCDIARDSAKEALKEGIKLDPDEEVKGLKKVKKEIVDMSVNLSKLHHTKLAPAIEPIAVEKQFQLRIKNILDFTLAGTIDIIEPGKIRDTKTVSRTVKDMADKSLQLTMYGLAEKYTGKQVDKFYLDLLHKDKLEIVTLETQRSESDYRALLYRIQNAMEQLKAGIFPPCNSDNWICNPKWCGYYDTCKFARRIK